MIRDIKKIRLYELRQSYGLSLRSFAELTGVSKSTLERLENKKGNPTNETLAIIAKSLGIEIEDLFEKDD